MDEASTVFDLVNNLLLELLQGNAQDVKTFASILHLIGNWLSLEPSDPYAQDILRVVVGSSSLLDCILDFLTNNSKLESETFELVCWVVLTCSQTKDLQIDMIHKLKLILLLCVRT